MLDFDSDGNTPPLLAENTSSEQYIDSVSYLSDEDVMSDKENRNQERNSQIISDSLSVPSEDSSINIEPVNDPNSPDPPDENVNLNVEPGGEWHPFHSRVHCQLVLLYQSSHRRNVDQITFRAFMEVLKVFLSDNNVNSTSL